MMTKRLEKQPVCNHTMNDELRISSKSLLLLFFLVLAFFVLSFVFVPQTYGFL